MDISTETRKKQLLLNPLQGVLKQGEALADAPVFILPKQREGVDLAALNWEMRGDTDKNTTTRTPNLAKSDDIDALRITWPVTEDYTAVATNALRLTLTGMDEQGDKVVIYTGDKPLVVQKAEQGEHIPPANSIEKMVRDMENLLAQAKDIAAQVEDVEQNPVKVGDNGNLWNWDREQDKYVDSGKPARGPAGNDGVIQTLTGDSYISVDSGDTGNVKVSLKGEPISIHTHTKSGTVHALTGSGTNIRFTATAGYITGDTFTVNGTVATFNGTPNFKIGDVVSCMLEGSKLTFATVPDVMGVLIENGFKGDTLPTITRISNVLENGFYVCNGSSGTAGTPTNSWYIVQVVRNGNWVRIIARQGWEVQNIYEKYMSADSASDSGWYKYTLTKV